VADQGEPREITQAATLKALAHPLRQRILRQLRHSGEATATTLAAALGENTGATSYHLRRLAEYGLVEEVPGHGRGRERWWRAPRHDLRFPPRSRMDEDMRVAFDELGRMSMAEDLAALARFERRRDELGEWGDALVFARGSLELTGQQLKDFWDDYMALYLRYARQSEPPGEGARRLSVRFLAFPEVD
jgi:DNA-binding transcriptional ArsR family regulator